MRTRRKCFPAPPPRWPSLAVIVALALALTLVRAHQATVLHPVATPAPRLAPTPTPAPPPCRADPAGLPPAVDAAGAALDYWHTCGTKIVDRFGRPIHVAGIAWSGMELAGAAPQGLDRRSYRSILQQVKALGYNVVRIPFSSEAIKPDARPSGIDPTLNPDLAGRTSLEVLDRIIAECHRLGLKVVLDHHRISPWSTPPRWYDDTYSTAQWIADWVRLARRYLGSDTVVGFDLQNEPYGATWGTGDPKTDWRLAATAAGNAILQANPRLLIFVQGIGRDGNAPFYWYGGELRGAAAAPIELALPGRLVYSPHEYGPSVYPETWFFAPEYPSNLPAIWAYHWGFILQRNLGPVVIGEMGAPETGYDRGGSWQRVFLSYLASKRIGFIAWSLNPGTSDTGSVLEPDWQTVNRARHQLYAPYLEATPLLPTPPPGRGVAMEKPTHRPTVPSPIGRGND